MTRLLLAGFDKAKSAEVQDVIKALEGIEVNDIVGRMRMDAATHQNCGRTSSCAASRRRAMKEAAGLRRHHRHRRHAAAEGIRGLQGHRRLLVGF